MPDGAALARALGGDARVAYVERDAKLRIAADPLDVVDPATGIKYTWFYDDVRAGEALLAAGGGSRRSIAVMDTGLDVSHPEFAGRIARTYDTFSKGKDVTDTVGHGTFVTGPDRGDRRQRHRRQGRGRQHARCSPSAARRTATSRPASCCAASTSRSGAARTCST